MTINEEILAIANSLANQGKKPTVALVKTKLTQPAPLPVIISVLKSWVHDPKAEEKQQPTNVDTTLSETVNEDSKIEQQIQRAIEPLMKEISELKSQIKKLIDKV